MSESVTIPLDKIKESLNDPHIVTIFSNHDKNMAVSLVAWENEQNEFIGVKMKCVKYDGEKIYEVFDVKKTILQNVFKPDVTKIKDSVYRMTINPLNSYVDIRKGKKGYKCVYSFEDQKKLGVISHIYTCKSLTGPVNYTVYGTFRKNKDSDPIELQYSDKAPKDFIENLIMTHNN